MTSTNVTQAAGLLLGGANVSAVNSMNQTVDKGFSQVMSRTSQDSGKEAQTADQNVQAASAKTPVKVERSSVKEAQENASVQEEDGKISDASAGEGAEVDEAAEVDETTAEILTEAAGKIKDAIEEELGISEEELETIMSSLGLTAMDLLQPENMQMIAMAAAGETDEMSILTNEALYQSVQALSGTVEEILSDVKSQLEMDDEQFASLLQQMEVNAEPETLEVPDMTGEKEQGPVVVIEQEAEVQTVKADDTETAETEDISKKALEKLEKEEEKAVPENAVEKKETGSGKASAENNREDSNPFLQGWSKTGLQAWDSEAVRSQAEMTFERVDAENIMNQITEYMKVQVKSEVTELQLQLQPETLGALHIHLTAKEGMVTAQFAAENEAVKTVLEAQVMQLKENLNEQGIKVEAVEVTVASHGFERSFADNGENGSRYEEPRKKSVRRIQLSDDTPLDEMELSDEERIAAEMMEQSGNTVDYTA